MFSERIRRLRKGKGLNQKELAEKLEISVDSVRRWEQGKRSPDVEMLCNIARVLKTTVSYLSGETDDEASIQSIPNVETVSSSSVQNKARLGDYSFMERLVKSIPMVIYDTGNERILIPATSEGFKFIERMKSGHA